MFIEVDKYLEFHCPRWSELPELERYMDQVLSIIEKNLSLFKEKQEREEKSKEKEDREKDNFQLLTPTMINNYVKHKILPPPQKKRYSKEHLALLHIICLAKRVLSMNEIKAVIGAFGDEYDISYKYDLFCNEIENALKITFGSTLPNTNIVNSELSAPHAVLCAFARSFSHKIYVQCAIACCAENNKKENVDNKN